MPKRKINIVKFVSYDEITKKSTCLVESCRKELCGKFTANIRRHYKLVHKQDIESESDSEDMHKKGNKDKTIKLSSTMDVHNEEILFTKKRRSIEKRDSLSKRPNVSTKINIDKNEFLKCCVGLVTVKNIPFQIFDDHEFFKTLIAPYEETFNTNLNSTNIVRTLESSSNKIRDIIRNKVKNRMISLKIDIATRMDRSVLCINIQYINNSKICSNNLGMIQLYKKQKVTFLTEELLNCLETYDIELEQIYSSTLDYGGNVIKFGQILQEQQQDEKINENDAHKYYDNIDEIADKIQRDLTPVLTEFVCAAHTIQLAAYDVIKTMQKPISDCRKAFKTVWNLMRASGAYEELPELDNAIGWNSIFEMLKSLQKLKDFIDSQFLEELNSQNAIWQFVYEFLESFTPLDNCSKLLQKEQYVLGDFYRDWLNCEIELEEITTATASKLREAMRKREKLLLENSAFLAALYLDPRFNFMNSTILSKQQKSQALEHLVKTFDMTQEMENVKEEEFIKTVDEPEEHYEKPTTSSGAYAKLAQRIMTSVVNTSKSAENNLTFREKLMNLSNTNMVSLDTNILEYFKATPLDSDVVKVINIALAVPAGQISVETAASALSLGNKLNNITLNNLLITKLNFAEIKPSSVNIDFHNEQDLKLSFY